MTFSDMVKKQRTKNNSMTKDIDFATFEDDMYAIPYHLRELNSKLEKYMNSEKYSDLRESIGQILKKIEEIDDIFVSDIRMYIDDFKE